MTIEPPVPRYVQVANHLRDKIKSGEYPPGSWLPSQPELAEYYGLAQTSISRAVSILRTEGLIRTDQGRRSIVQEFPTAKRVRRIPGDTDSKEGSFAAEMRRLGLEPSNELANVDVVHPPEEIAEYLRLGESERVLMRLRHMFGSGNPVQMSTSYIPMSIAESVDFAYPDVGPTGMYRRLEERGYRIGRSSERVQVRVPESNETKFLQLPPGQDVYWVLRTTWAVDGRPLEVSENVMSARQWELLYEWPYVD